MYFLPHDPFNDASSAPSFVPFQALDQVGREDSGLDLDFDIFFFLFLILLLNSFILFERAVTVRCCFFSFFPQKLLLPFYTCRLSFFFLF